MGWLIQSPRPPGRAANSRADPKARVGKMSPARRVNNGMTSPIAASAPVFAINAVPLPLHGVRWIHQLLWRAYGIRPEAVLNSGSVPEVEPDGLPVAADLYRMAKALQAAAYDPLTGRLDYSGLAGSALFAEYRLCARRLQVFDPATLPSREARLAFWINLYNALIIDAVIACGVKRSVQQIRGFFWRAAYNIGGRRYSAHDIEHGILRANRAYPAIPGRQFGPRDPRRQYSLTTLEARIHFTLVCAARSCPPIAVYDADHVDTQLDLATRTFVNSGGVTIDPQAKVIWLSKIFQWYAPDFGAAPLGLGRPQPLLNFVAPYLTGGVSQSTLRAGGWRVRFRPYDWRLNDAAA